MDNQIKLNDIADNLLIFDKKTVDALFKLENCADCIALYSFYYKTAKWQKTNTIKAVDNYVKMSLKWGSDKIKRTKQTLKEHGLISIVQRRKDGKIDGWYIEVSYLVAQKKTEEINIKVEETKNTQNQEVEKPTSGFGETNALKEKIKCLEKEIEMLKKKEIKEINKNALENEFERLWQKYPRKVGKEAALKAYIRARSKEDYGKFNEYIVLEGIKRYTEYIKKNNILPQYVKQGSTWFNQHCWEDDYSATTPSNDRFYKSEPVEDDLPF